MRKLRFRSFQSIEMVSGHFYQNFSFCLIRLSNEACIMKEGWISGQKILNDRCTVGRVDSNQDLLNA
jgi:hypothetical protein